MNPREFSEYEDADPNFQQLVGMLRSSQVSIDEAPALSRWLSDESGDRVVQWAMEELVSNEAISEQVIACSKLERSASQIAERLDFLNQVSALEQVLAQSYGEIVGALQCDGYESVSEVWTAFRNRLLSDALVLKRLAEMTATRLKNASQSKGRRRRNWRNNCFTELVDRLQPSWRRSQEECIALAQSLWNIYFPKDKIMEPDSAQKIVQRERERRAAQGH